jgi:hypothetical protein
MNSVGILSAQGLTIVHGPQAQNGRLSRATGSVWVRPRAVTAHRVLVVARLGWVR